MKTLLHALFFQGVWFGSVYGASRGWGWAGPLLVLVFIGVLFTLSDRRGAEARMIGASALIGFALDSLLGASGLLAFAAPLPSPIAPPWVVGLWAAFATFYPRSLRWLQGRYLVAALLGAISGPMTYFGAARLGGAEITGSTTHLGVFVAVEYALALPLMLVLSQRLFPQEPDSADAADPPNL